jgi:hypothetical protein
VAAALEGDLSDLEDVEELEEDFMLLANGNQSDTVFDQKKRMTDKPSENEALRRFGLVREPHSNFSSDDEDEDDEDASDEDVCD